MWPAAAHKFAQPQMLYSLRSIAGVIRREDQFGHASASINSHISFQLSHSLTHSFLHSFSHVSLVILIVAHTSSADSISRAHYSAAAVSHIAEGAGSQQQGPEFVVPLFPSFCPLSSCFLFHFHFLSIALFPLNGCVVSGRFFLSCHVDCGSVGLFGTSAPFLVCPVGPAMWIRSFAVVSRCGKQMLTCSVVSLVCPFA